MYVAFDLASNRTASFDTVADAHEYIKSCCCVLCQKDAAQGFIRLGKYDKMYILSIMETAYGCEWDVITQQEFEDLQQ